MWEQLAARYNGSRTRSSSERDFESLRRKFKKLYGKPKPTGKGEVPLRLRSIVWAQEIQMKIEASAGVQTSHDGPDDGEDDDTLQSVVDAVLGGDEHARQSPVAGINDQVLDAEMGGARNRPDTHEAAPESEVQPSDIDSETESPPCTVTLTPSVISQYAQPTDLGESDTQGDGVIVTSSGIVDVRLASHFSFSDDEELQQDSQPGAGDGDPPGSSPECPPGFSIETTLAVSADDATATSSRQSSSGTSRDLISSQTTRESRPPAEDHTRASRRTHQPPMTPTPTPTPRTSTTPGRSVGRPRAQSRQHIATVATPDGPVLRRDPERAAADEREEKENRALNVTSNRQDMRVLRDNVDALTQSLLNDNGKRSPVQNSTADGAAGSPSYAARKRIRMQQRLDDMQKEMDEAEQKHSGGTGEIMKLLLFFQKDSDRRAENEERRRRSEREERAEADKRERAEREQIRREEAEAADRRHVEELRLARELRAEQRRLDTERDAKLDREKGRTGARLRKGSPWNGASRGSVTSK
ncbi:hypothetical protein PF010_g3107 [Phytophthora fragariae]|uniref:DUF6818 domain-containing protein n=3 Tax=Phytophthora fragariae TaxID=53985 RepID=A0A6A4E4L6_9STRA|nr:hypothetical protein PF003_g38232 [Phytophthora fragariae]KAE9132633.1 hypothetical protein PF010_g3107 [Phytophthora fragariae]KAE9245058.1 hypothetical protein PF002_g7435 [Phytophthora fragariae]KAE9319636.1 hypothetical protein PF001_g5788 [Phytophthora fragariae]